MKSDAANSHGLQLYATILLLIALPMLALSLLGIWFADAQRFVAAEAERQEQQAAARNLADDVMATVGAEAAQRADLAIAAWREGGAQRLRTHYLADPAIEMVALFDADGVRQFPGAEESSLFSENRQLRESARRMDELLTQNNGAPIKWSGNLSEAATPAIACLDRGAGAICLLLRAAALRRSADVAADPAQIADLNMVPPALGGMAQALSPLPAPFFGAAIVTSYPPDQGRNLSTVLLLLAPTLLGSIIAALFAMRAHRAQIGSARQRIDMLAGLSHDLRTPLANLRLYASLLRKPELTPDRLARYADVIEREAAQLATTVDQVLAAPETQLPATLQRISPDQLVGDLIGRYRPAFANALPPVLDLRSPAPALFDANVFERVLLNLLDNARKHAPRAAPTVATAVSHGRVLLTVSDSGGAAAPDTTGFGLGLRTCRAMALQAGGSFSAAIAPEGSRFLLTLPDHLHPSNDKGYGSCAC